MRTNKHTNTILLVTTLILGIMFLSMVSASVDLRLPTGTVTGTSVVWAVNLSESSNPAGGNFTCNLTATSTLTANNSAKVSLAYANNNTHASAGSNFTNGTFNSAGLEDANNYIFAVTCYNSSATLGTDTNTGIIVQNTVPTAPSSLTPTSDTDGGVSFSSTVVGRETTSCTLYFNGINPGASSYTMTHSGATCTKDLTSMPESTYKWYVQASDETDTTNSAETTLNVDTKSSAGATALLASQSNLQSEGGASFSIKSGLSKELLGLPIGVWLILALITGGIVVAVKYK